MALRKGLGLSTAVLMMPSKRFTARGPALFRHQQIVRFSDDATMILSGRLPSEKQLSYAHDLSQQNPHITMPDAVNTCAVQCSAFIDKVLDSKWTILCCSALQLTLATMPNGNAMVFVTPLLNLPWMDVFRQSSETFR
eukprot:SAG31_NODE_5743_length_2349_cov_1.514667_2_plen_138_part_00